MVAGSGARKFASVPFGRTTSASGAGTTTWACAVIMPMAVATQAAEHSRSALWARNGMRLAFEGMMGRAALQST